MKFKKEAVLYAFNPETQYTCGQCVNRIPDTNLCALFSPNDKISPEHGSCGFYVHEDGTKTGIYNQPLGNVSKIQAGYAENKKGFSCKRCEYFIAGKNDCKAVDKNSEGLTPGEIHPNACCNNWDADKVRAKMGTAELLAKLSKLNEDQLKTDLQKRAGIIKETS